MNKRLFVAVVLLLAFSASACGYGERKIENATGETADKIYISPTEFPSDGMSGRPATSLEVCGQEGILLLTASYYSALADGDLSALNALVSNPENLTENVLNRFQGVSKIHVKNVYTVDGTKTVGTVAYVYCELTFEGYDTIVPSLDELFISDSNGTYTIFNGTLPTEEYNSLSQISQSEGVTQLVESVNRSFNEALDSDASLKDYIKNGGA